LRSIYQAWYALNQREDPAPSHILARGYSQLRRTKQSRRTACDLVVVDQPLKTRARAVLLSSSQEFTTLSSNTYHKTLTQSENILYGSSRLGMEMAGKQVVSGYFDGATMTLSYPNEPTAYSKKEVGKKRFELSNHLGNVLAVVSDHKMLDPGATQVEHFNPDVTTASEYYPFGMQMPGRSYNSGDYRYGFIGAENDPEISGRGNSQNHEFRQYNPRLGKYMSLDPLAPDYPWNSPFAYAENRVIDGIDLEGREYESMTTFWMEHDNKALLKNEMTEEEWKARGQARLMGGAVGAVIVLSAGLAVELFGAEVVAAYLFEEALETTVEEVTGVPIILGPDDILQQGGKKLIKEGLEEVLSTSQKRAINGLQDQILKHKKKLADFKADPDKFDNKGFLKDASQEIREKIINSRVKSLEKQIKTFEKDIDAIKDGTKNVLESDTGG